jgi:hypothetical protein
MAKHLNPFLDLPMIRTTISLLALTLCAVLAKSAPKLEGLPSPFCPIEVGAKRVYKAVDVDWVEEIVAVENKEGEILVTMIRTYPVGTTQATVYRMSATRLDVVAEGKPDVVADGKAKINPPECLVMLPIADKIKWENQITIGTLGRGQVRTPMAKSRVVGEEVVEVSAGKFSAVRVDTELPFVEGKPIRRSRWYASKVGLVREVEDEKEVGVLKSFSSPAPAKSKR